MGAGMGGGQGNPATSGLACSPDIPKDAYLGLEKGLRFLSEKLPPPPDLICSLLGMAIKVKRK